MLLWDVGPWQVLAPSRSAGAIRLHAQVDLKVGFREPVKRRPQRLTVTHGSFYHAP